MKLLCAIALFFFIRLAHPAYQCYQCTHDERNPDVDCINSDIKYLKNCTDDGQGITDWDCYQMGNYTRTTVLYVYRQCVPRTFLDICTSEGAYNWTDFSCYCNIDGCNNLVPKPVDANSTTTTTATTNTTTTTSPGNGNGSGSTNLTLSAKWIVYYLLASSCIFAFSHQKS